MMKKIKNYNLNDLRLKKFEQNVVRSVKSVTVQKFPPTTSAAKYHPFRVYYQVQVQLENETLQITYWGWELINGNLYPIKIDTPPAPAALMKIIKCRCTLQCDTNKCKCKKNGLFCTQLCHNNTSSIFINIEKLDLIDEDVDTQKLGCNIQQSIFL